MSDSTGLIVISFLGVTGFFVNFRLAKMVNDMGAQICTGVIDGSPTPTRQRWYLLQSWASYVFGGLALSIFVAVAQVLMANNVSSEDAKLLGHMAAFMFGIGALMWVVQGGLMFVNYRSVLRQAEAD